MTRRNPPPDAPPAAQPSLMPTPRAHCFLCDPNERLLWPPPLKPGEPTPKGAEKC